MKFKGGVLRRFFDRDGQEDNLWPFGDEWYFEPTDYQNDPIYDDNGNWRLNDAETYDIDEMGYLAWQGIEDEPAFVTVNGQKIQVVDGIAIGSVIKAALKDVRILVVQVPAGDEDAFKALVKEHKGWRVV